MNTLTLGHELFPCHVTARNYATASDNRIHSDDVAALYGFTGGLVPGVGNYAYLTRPVVEALGREWLERGAMTAKFLKPVYDGETVCVRGKVTGIDPLSISLELFNPAGTLCAVAQASLPPSPPVSDPADYPERALPDFVRRPQASLANLPAGLILGSRESQLNLAGIEAGFVKDVCDTLPIYRGPEAVCHPAFLLAEANQILADNVALGPWLHTGSEVRHYSLPLDGETLSLRGKVAESYVRRSHEFVVLDLGMFAGGSRAVARIRHTAIIRLRESAA
jgi:acyl dehydratase